MNYEQAMEQDNTVKAYQAKQEIEKHYLSFDDFVLEYGEQIEYYTKDVLNWLGY